MRALRRAAGGMALLAVLAGCEGTTPLTGVAVMDRGGGSFVITVTGGAAPTYSWSGGNARRLVVRNLDTGAPVWELAATAIQDGFPSPVAQGAVPAGAREVLEADLIEAGSRYEVRITLVDGLESAREFNP